MNRRILSNSFANMIGGVVPALASLITIPYIVTQLGEVNYGVLAMVMAIVGYFAILDLNLTAGAVKYVAEYHALGRRKELGQTITFGALIYLAIGIAGAIVLYLGAPLWTDWLFNVPATLRPLTVDTLELAACGFMFGQLQSYAQGLPQALQRYDVSARIEAAFGTLIPVLTVLLLWLGCGLYEVVLLRVVASAVNLSVLWLAVRRLLPEFRFVRPERAVMLQLAAFSGFAYLSKLAATAYAHADKLIIGALAGMSALTYYVVPFTLVSRVFAMTYRLVGVVFPATSELAAKGEMARLERIYLSAARYVFFLNASVVLVFVLFAYEILYFWMGPTFANEGAIIMALIALAVLVDSATNLPSLVNDGLGHPRVTSLFAIARATFGLLLAYILVKQQGILGAALAQLGVSLVMASAFLLYVHGRSVPYSLVRLLRYAYLPTALWGGALAALVYLLKPAQPSLVQIALNLAVLALILLGFGYRFVLTPHHRAQVCARLGRLCPAGNS